MKIKKNNVLFFVGCIAVTAILLYISLFFKDRKSAYGEPLVFFSVERQSRIDIDKIIANDLKTKDLEYTVQAVDEGKVVFSTYNSGGYRYGPSIMTYEDGSMDAWFSAPGNNSTQWDWITYRHSDDGEHWSAEKIVLKPTPDSKDRCSVCDPGLVYFNDYYYMAYTSTSDYSRKGYNNSAFVARSRNPDGPYEKWNGKSWGGYPQPIIAYEGSPYGWGIGEISFVVKDRELYIYYTYFDTTGGSCQLAKADLSDDWPSTVTLEGMVCPRVYQDSLDVFYSEKLDTFLAMSIDMRMTESSRLIMYESKDGKDFKEADTSNRYIEHYAHNLGVAKNELGHSDVDDELLVGYGFGRGWGRWSAKFQKVKITYKMG